MRAALVVLLLACAGLGCVSSVPAKYDPPDERFVLFNTSSVDVTNADGYFALGYVVAMLEEHPTYRVLVVGHADTTGSTDRNRDLCFRRARSVRKILLSHGVTEDRVTIAAPQQGGDAAMSAMLSRRADVYLYDPKQEDVLKRLGYPVDSARE